MTPGEQHRALDPLVGKWKAKVSSWMQPGAKPEVSEGTSENAWALNGRHVQQKYNGTWTGQPFEGVGYTGFDLVRGEYQSVWLDSMGTSMMMVAGTYDAATKTIRQSGTMSCAMTGEKAMWYRSELKIHGPNKHTYTSYTKGPDGKEFKGMEIVYIRAK